MHGWINLWSQRCRKGQGVQPCAMAHPAPSPSSTLPISPFWCLQFLTEEQYALEIPLQLWNNSAAPANPPSCQGFLASSSWKEKLLNMAAVYHPQLGVLSAAGALSTRPLSISELTNFHVDCKAGNVYTCHSYSWPKCFVLTVALTMGHWHHLLVIVWCAIDTSGFTRMYNLIIRPHLQSNHESHYGGNARESWGCGSYYFWLPLA